MLLPLQAFATICWTDSLDPKHHPELGNRYFVELGSSSEGTIALSGYVKVAPGAPCKGFDGIAPLFGTAVVDDSDTAVIGWLVISIDNAHECIGYRERLSLLRNGDLAGEYYLDSDGTKGDDYLTRIACPKSHDERNQNPLKHFDK
jgi:hypothetical protein